MSYQILKKSHPDWQIFQSEGHSIFAKKCGFTICADSPDRIDSMIATFNSVNQFHQKSFLSWMKSKLLKISRK
jgi:hypothetical protein